MSDAPEVQVSSCTENAAINRRCAYSKCGVEFTPTKKGHKAKFCCGEHRRLGQNEQRREATNTRRNAHYERLNRDRTQEFDSRSSGSRCDFVGPYRSAKRERRERAEYEELDYTELDLGLRLDLQKQAPVDMPRETLKRRLADRLAKFSELTEAEQQERVAYYTEGTPIQ